MKLYNYLTGAEIREATDVETKRSIEAAKTDGGSGVIEIDGQSCYVTQ